uniref:Integrase core domain containing protein n=1 Tax=Solanum tuberosum TaxID=4113 RepID=M1DNW0_SOLTU
MGSPNSTNRQGNSAIWVVVRRRADWTRHTVLISSKIPVAPPNWQPLQRPTCPKGEDQANSQEEELDQIIEYNPAHEEQNGNESGKDLPLTKSQTSPAMQNAEILSGREEYNQASKTTCIDSMLPIPKRPHENLLLAMTDEVKGGMDGEV